MEEKVLAIDWSALVMNRLYSLLSGNMPITRASETEELRYRIGRAVYEMMDITKPTRVHILKDYKEDGKRDYWREDYLIEYYINNTTAYTSGMDTYIKFDNQLYMYNDGKVGHKVTKKNTPSDLIETTLTPDEIREVCPKYKGGRHAEWVFLTPKSEVMELFNTIASEMSTFLPKCRVIEAKGAEADDIAGVITRKSQVPHVLATIDGDWHQLIDDHVTILDLGSSDLRILDKTKKQVADELCIKLIMGDIGDNVMGTWIDGKAGRMGKVKATKCFLEGTQDQLNREAYARNNKLITLNLDTIPQWVQDGILASAKNPVQYPGEFTWSNYTLNKRELSLLSRDDKVMAQNWLETPCK